MAVLFDLPLELIDLIDQFVHVDKFIFGKPTLGFLLQIQLGIFVDLSLIQCVQQGGQLFGGGFVIVHGVSFLTGARTPG